MPDYIETLKQTCNPLTEDGLMAVCQAGPLLDKVEEALRAEGYETEANQLIKLQQDAGVQMDRAFCGYDPSEPAPGIESAKLWADFEPADFKRAGMVFTAVLNRIADERLRADLVEFVATMNIPVVVGNSDVSIRPSGYLPS